MALLPVGFTKPNRSRSPLVVSYTTVSPLPAEAGGLLSVALSVDLRRPRFPRHRALRSPDFPHSVRAHIPPHKTRPSIHPNPNRSTFVSMYVLFCFNIQFLHD